MQINFSPNAPTLNVGDFIQFKGNLYYLVESKEGKGVELVSMNGSKIYSHDTFAHPVHVINHIKKHHGDDYRIFPSCKAELNIID